MRSCFVENWPLRRRTQETFRGNVAVSPSKGTEVQPHINDEARMCFGFIAASIGRTRALEAGLVAILKRWTLRLLHAIRIARQCRCQDECCSGVEQGVRDVIYRFIELRC